MAIKVRIINMDPVIEQILNSSFTIHLPSVYTTNAKDSSQKKEGDITPAGQQEEEKRGKKQKGRGDNNKTRKYIKNNHMIAEFRMKEGEDWRQDLEGKNIKDRPKWNDNCYMCVRWFTKGDCFTDCNSKDSHVVGRRGTNQLRLLERYLDVLVKRTDCPSTLTGSSLP